MVNTIVSELLGAYRLDPKLREEQKNLGWGSWARNWFDRPILIIKKMTTSWSIVSFVRDDNTREYGWTYTNAYLKHTRFLKMSSKNRRMTILAIFRQTENLLYAIRDAKLSEG